MLGQMGGWCFTPARGLLWVPNQNSGIRCGGGDPGHAAGGRVALTQGQQAPPTEPATPAHRRLGAKLSDSREAFNAVPLCAL